MTNHPNRNRASYWLNRGRGFANEFAVSVARNSDHAAKYQAAGWERITRHDALERMSMDGCRIDVDHGTPWDRGEMRNADIVRAIRGGGLTSIKVIRG